MFASDTHRLEDPSIMRSLLIVAATAATVHADEFFIDFETLPNGAEVLGGTEVIDQYAEWGIVFDAVTQNGAQQTTDIIDFLDTPSAVNMLAPGGPQPFHGGTLILNFTVPVFEAGAFFVDDGFVVDVFAYDASDMVVDTDQSDGNASGFDEWSVSHGAGIVRVELVSRNIIDGWGIDDLSYTQVPAPGAVALLALGVFACRRTR